MKKLILLFILSFNAFSQVFSPVVVEEKHFYIGENNIATGIVGPWPVDQLGAINAICEVIFEGASSIPVKVTHLKLNGDGTLKCPAEKDAANIIAADAIDADELSMSMALKAMDCGKKVKARMLMKNAGKGLNNGQKKQILTTFKDIDALLSAGSLDAARSEIDLAIADGVLITTGDKVALIAELDKCK